MHPLHNCKISVIGLVPKESESTVGQSLPEADVAALKKRLAQNKRISALCLGQHEKGLFPDYNAIKARVLQEDESLPIDRICEKKYSSTPMHMSSPIVATCYIPPIQLQSFGDTQVSMPKESKCIGGQSYQEWAEIEKKIKANFAAHGLEQIEKELAQRKEALPVDIIDEKNDDSKSENSLAGKAESTSVCSESIKSKEASTIEKGHSEHIKTVVDLSTSVLRFLGNCSRALFVGLIL